MKRKNERCQLRLFWKKSNKLFRENPSSGNGFLEGQDFHQQKEPCLFPDIPDLLNSPDLDSLDLTILEAFSTVLF